MSESDVSPTATVRDHLPGLAVTVLATLAAAYVSDHYGAPLTLMCLLFGLALNFLGTDARLAPGLTLASRTLLRWGIVFVAARVTLTQIAELGPIALLAVVVIVGVTLAVGVLAARTLGFTAAFGALCGGAVAICGASAAMAFASLLGERRASQAQLTLVLVGISAMSAVAMTLYPILAHHFGFDDLQAGFMLGASIHDVAQTLGAGYAFSPAAGETATIVKLARVALLAPAMLAVAVFIPREPGAKISSFVMPWFVVGFFGLAGVNSLGVIPAAAADASVQASTALLACAVTATGVRSNMQSLTQEGLRPMLVIIAATLVALALATAAAAFLIS
ncbi:MAG: putative sulfate exporter family transporter [Alphaproteobacteria bacterium]|nr:putative sulfate exporter family transporter [Alphaproteobacteria bacterium]MBU1516400.1 putative sulfate exporter family transporter [Alphaproteobacteria bacterium]MBU2093363.1 putative sulfate exporter family transporter [Alphaproteobacteria bacterium]MBU2153850.1 putative sulfate exporter family transporter [Alphaproteobacteria bacterium]MBU2307722.1 putative sulfate exporter family transporter [Alphaproteobacteria bacterium]